MLPLDENTVCSWNSFERSAAPAFLSGGRGHGRRKVFFPRRCFPGSGLRSGFRERDVATLAAGRRGVSSVGLCPRRELLGGVLRDASRAVLRGYAVLCQAGRAADRCPLGAARQCPPSVAPSRKAGHLAHVQRGLLRQTTSAAPGLECRLPDPGQSALERLAACPNQSVAGQLARLS